MAAMLCGTAPALQAAIPAATHPAVADEPLFVELVVNGRATGEIVAMRMIGQEPLIEAEALRRAGVRTALDGAVNAMRMDGISAQYDPLAQSLRIDVSPDMLPLNRLSSDARQQQATVADLGLLINYDAYAEAGGGRFTASLWSEQRLFGPMGMLTHNGTLRLRSRPGGSTVDYIRFDSFYSLVDERSALVFTAGDLITRSIAWTGSVRMGGIQVAHDYDVRPDLITAPLPSFAGRTAVPTTLDLFIDGHRQHSADVAPGRFVLDDIPVVNGAGQATIVTTDAVGRQISTTIPFYASSQLLRPGLLDASGEIGFLRRGHGVRSFDYGPLAISGTLRRGLTRHVTVEAHLEGVRGLRLGGAGVVWTPGLLGTVNLSIAASDHRRDGRGTQWTMGYGYTARRFSVAVEHVRRSGGYRDLGSFDLARFDGRQSSTRMVGTVNIPRQGSVGAAYLDVRSGDGSRARIASLSYSRPIGTAASLFFAADHEFVRGGTTAHLRLIIPFGRDSIGIGVNHSGRRDTLLQLDYSRSMPSEGGVRTAANLAAGQDGQVYGQGSIGWRGRHVELDGGAAVTPQRRAVWAGATGSVVLMAGQVFGANRVTDAFALVSTGGVADVPVSYENQTIGTTNAAGYLFVPKVSAYHDGRFGIDILAMPADHIADAVERRVALRNGAGALIEMPVRSARHVTFSLVDADGVPLGVGGRVRRVGAADAEIGWDGIVFLPDVRDKVELDVMMRDGRSCRAALIIPAASPALADLGAVACR